MKSGDLAARIGELVAAGRTIEAIKVLREATGLGLADAKQVIDAVTGGAPIPPQVLGRVAPGQVPATARADLPDDVRQVAAAGDRVRAIRMLRERTGIGLKEAKDLVDREVPVAAGGRRGCLLPLLFGCVVAWSAASAIVRGV